MTDVWVPDIQLSSHLLGILFAMRPWLRAWVFYEHPAISQPIAFCCQITHHSNNCRRADLLTLDELEYCSIGVIAEQPAVVLQQIDDLLPQLCFG